MLLLHYLHEQVIVCNLEFLDKLVVVLTEQNVYNMEAALSAILVFLA